MSVDERAGKLPRTRSMPKQPLALRLHTDPAYVELVRMVGYLGIAYPISGEENNRLMTKYGKQKLIEASDEIIDYDTAAKIARLKPGVRRLCRGLLGPAPEEWEQFYEGVENPPPNPYTTKATKPEPKPKRKRQKRLTAEQETDLVAEAVADAIREETGMNVVISKPDPLQTLQLEVLEEKLNSARMRCLCSKTVKAQNRAYQEVQQLLAEYERRKTPAPPEPAAAPAPQAEFDVAGFHDFKKATTHRLRELLDMNQYEVAKYEPESVTHQEALRDIGFIEAELRRRREGDTLDEAQVGSRRR